MIQISNLSFSYQNHKILDNINLTFSDAEIVAIIGDNGAGKTTLLRLIAGELSPDDGCIKSPSDIGFLKQDQEGLNNKSGGERTMMRLAEILRTHPGTLLLDEPTNNLDADGKRWLTQNLRKYRGTILLVSHDRDFINQVVDRVVYLHAGHAEVFAGNYNDFMAHQTQKQHLQEIDYTNLQREKRKLQRQLKLAKDQANKSNHHYRFNKMDDESRMNYNGQRMGAQNSAGRVLRSLQSKVEQLPEPKKPHQRKVYQAELSSNLKHRKRILGLDSLAKSHGGRLLFSNLNLELYTGERLRVEGRNGSGKSTLFKIILGKSTPDNGTVWLAPNLKIGYISQDVSGLDLSQSFVAQASAALPTEIYQAATTMDFLPEDLRRPCGELSRGQQTKLAILKLILRPLDLVILDELTNHLDLRARENIEHALVNYCGAILFATHDEKFAETIGSKSILLEAPS